MKKVHLFQILGIMSLITFYACQKNQVKDECVKCKENTNYVLKPISFGDLNLEFKLYKTDDWDFALRGETKEEIYKRLINDFNIPISKSEIVSINFYSKSTDDSVNYINPLNVEAVLIYYKVNNQLLTELYQGNLNNGFILNKKFSQKSSFVSTNDIHDICRIINYNSVRYTCITFLNSKIIPKLLTELSTFQEVIDLEIKKINSVHSSKRIADIGQEAKRHCDQTTCGSVSEGFCAFHESQNGNDHAYCLDLKDCPKEETNQHLPLKYKEFVLIQDDSLRKFRDEYLFNRSKGKEYINLYYQLSSKINLSEINVEFAIETYNVINEEIMPIISKLMKNKNSSDILLNQTSASRIIVYLEKTKSLFSTQDDLLIDKLINDVSFYKNKSTFVVNNHLLN